MSKYLKHPFPYILAILLSILYFSIPAIAKSISQHPTFAKYAVHDASRIANYVQQVFLFPFGKLLSSTWRAILVLPYLLVILLTIRSIYLYAKKFWNGLFIGLGFVLFVLYLFPNILLVLNNNKASKAHGTVSNGWIENSKRVNFSGSNFSTYSFLGYLARRTFAHEKVKATILEAYTICEKTCPNTDFVLGETGRPKGGLFLPHRTHRNGLSVDFMSPLLKNGNPYTSHHIFNIWGYGIEFDQKGKLDDITIDYEVMAQHILALTQAAKKNGLRIQKIIFDPVLKPYLLATATGKKIKHLPFTKNRVVVRHDDHYHIDFAIK